MSLNLSVKPSKSNPLVNWFGKIIPSTVDYLGSRSIILGSLRKVREVPAKGKPPGTYGQRPRSYHFSLNWNA